MGGNAELIDQIFLADPNANIFTKSTNGATFLQ